MTGLEVARYALRTFELHFDSDIILGPLARFVPNEKCWIDGTCTAQCLRPEYGISRRDARKGAFLPAPHGHTAPHRACSCGIYGSLDYGCLRDQYWCSSENITAVIAAEGVTIIGTKGLRTQYARVVAYRANDSLRRQIAQQQFKDAQEYDTIHEMLDAYNLPVYGSHKTSGRAYGHQYWR